MEKLIKNVVRPVVTRIGTAFGVYLLSTGLPEPLIQEIATVAAATMLFFVDMWTRELFQRGEK